MTAGQRAYEEDVRRQPNYPDGSARVPWDRLSPISRESWERNPTPRTYRTTPAGTLVPEQP